ncbi:MAG: 16S rRNA (uracil(1498)-N(3))-methyltransferase [bacterium]
MIGPEGGFIPYEVEKLVDAGCQAFSFGPRILKVEQAIVYAAAQIARTVIQTF